jgi:hypothetical protein
VKVANCAPMETQRATGDVAGATAHATGAQQGTLKALADAVLVRNRERNGSASEGKKARNVGLAKTNGELPPLEAGCAPPWTLPDPSADASRQRVLDLLAANPSKRYSLVTDTEADPEAVIMALAIRGRATCELRIPRDKYDGPLLLDLLERHGGIVH